MSQYVDLDEVVTVTKENELGQVYVYRRTVADILNELDADYTPLEAYEIKEKEND